MPGLVPVIPIVPPPDPTALELDGIVIKLGSIASQPAVLGALLQTALTNYAVETAAAATTWGGNPISAPAFAAALATAGTTLATALGNILSLKVRIE